MKLCTIEGCDRVVLAKGLCRRHYRAAVRNEKRGGKPGIPGRPPLPDHAKRKTRKVGFTDREWEDVRKFVMLFRGLKGQKHYMKERKEQSEDA